MKKKQQPKTKEGKRKKHKNPSEFGSKKRNKLNEGGRHMAVGIKTRRDHVENFFQGDPYLEHSARFAENEHWAGIMASGGHGKDASFDFEQKGEGGFRDPIRFEDVFGFQANPYIKN
jgi:hypothetical protein